MVVGTTNRKIASAAQKLDGLIASLENELGERSVAIHPDDPWAVYRLETFSVSPHLQVVRDAPSYMPAVLTQGRNPAQLALTSLPRPLRLVARFATSVARL